MRLIGLAALLALGLFAAPLAVEGQQARKLYRIGYMSVRAGPTEPNEPLNVFRQAMQELGYLEGRNLVLEVRYAGGNNTAAHLRDIAAELVRLRVDVILAPTGQAAAAAKEATRTIPIVMGSSGDAVLQGLVASLAHPGGNVTGSTMISPQLSQKRLELLREVMPKLVRVGVIRCSRGAVPGQEWSETQTAGGLLGVQLTPLVVHDVEDLSGAFGSAVRQRVQAVLMFDCSELHPQAPLIVDLAMTSGLPAMYPFPAYPRAGGLMSYGADPNHGSRRAAAFVDKILKGAKPADLPVEQPTKFELVINLKTAKALGLTIPQTLLLRADQVIE
jgi:putative ABC transport system substrate-binding protein